MKNNAYRRFLAISVHFPRKYNFNFVLTLEVIFCPDFRHLFDSGMPSGGRQRNFMSEAWFCVFSNFSTKVTQKNVIEVH